MSYSWRGRIGLLLPAVNTTMERDFWAFAPPGFTVHGTRFASGHEGSKENLVGMSVAAKDAAQLLAFSLPDVAVFGCTSGSFVEGADWASSIEDELSTTLGCPTVTTSTAMVEALREVGARRIGVLSPYVEQTNTLLAGYLADSGFEVAKLTGLNELDMFAHALISRDTIYNAALTFASSDVDALFIACTQLQVSDDLVTLESDLGSPVIGAVQCSWWAAMRRIGGRGLPVNGYGSLLKIR